MQPKHTPLWSMTALALRWVLCVSTSTVVCAQTPPVEVAPMRTPDARPVAVAQSSTEASAPVTEASTPRRRALLVGVGHYPPANDWPTLAGPLADVDALRSALITRSGFAAGDIAVLEDAQATRAGILSGFEHMIAEAAPGDLLLFYFAGHGSLLPDEDGDELDRWDETLVPYDAVAGGGKHNDIRDEEIGELIRRANTKTDQVVLIFDCCSSGTNTRDGSGPASRFLEPTKRGLDAARVSAQMQPVKATGSGYVPPKLRYVSLAACRAHESAYEMGFDTRASEAVLQPRAPLSYCLVRALLEARARGPEPQPRGLFSYCLVEALLQIDPGLSYTDWMVETQSRVSAQGVQQTPIIEGSLASYRMFQSVASERARRFELTRSDEGVLTVACGRLHALEVGALLSVCPSTSLRDSASERVGSVRLTDVGATESRAEWTTAPRPGEVPAHCAAFLLEHGVALDALGVSIQGGELRRAELAQRVDAAPLLALVDADHASLSVEWREDGAQGRWQVCTTSRTPLPLTADPASAADMDRLLDNLERLGLAEHTARLLSAEELATLAFDVDAAWVDDEHQLAAKIDADLTGKRLVPEGRTFALRVTNRCEIGFYATLIVISPDGEVTLIDPPTQDDQISPGQSTAIPCELGIPPGHGAFYETAPARLAVLVTPLHHDVHALEQPPVCVQESSRGATQPLDLAAQARALAHESWTSKFVELWVVRSAK